MSRGIVGDAYLHRKTITELMDRKLSMHQAKDQAISGKKYENARDLQEQVVIVNNLQQDILKNTSYIKNNKAGVKYRVGEEERVIRMLQEEIIKFKTSLVAFNDGNEKDPAAFLNGVKEHLIVVQREGNTKIGNSYIFGGTITNNAPFKLSKVADGLDPASGVTTDYYEGNSETIYLAVSDENDVKCELKGNHPAFEKFIRALKIANDPSIKSGDARIKVAQDLADESLTAFADLVSQIGSKDETLDRLIQSQEDQLVYLENAYEQIVDAEEVDVISQFMQDQNILSSAYAMLSHLGQMSLSEHWRA